jgi:DNA-directed RNA polymerase specialized sigma24 family protein
VSPEDLYPPSHEERGLDSPTVSASAPAGERDTSLGSADLDAAVLEHAALVGRFVRRRIRNAEDAADITQQTLMLACQNLRMSRVERVRPWVLTIARHLVIDYYRARGRAEFVDLVAESADPEPALQISGGEVQAHLDCRRRVTDWLACMRRNLAMHEQVALLLADLHGYRDLDSARLLGMSLPSFKLMLHRARARICVAGGKCPLLEGRPAEIRVRNSEQPCGPHDTQEVSCRISARDLLTLRAGLLRDLPGLSLMLWFVGV